LFLNAASESCSFASRANRKQLSPAHQPATIYSPASCEVKELLLVPFAETVSTSLLMFIYIFPVQLISKAKQKNNKNAEMFRLAETQDSRLSQEAKKRDERNRTSWKLNQINMHDTLITRPAIPKLEQIEERSLSSLCLFSETHANADPNSLFMLIQFA
jgi:hypothetical protein